MTFRERVLGMFVGVAYGDALGATIEKLSHDEIVEKYGRIETYKMDWHKAQWPPEDRKHRVRGHGIFTDDTLMTMALMEVYNKEKRHLDAYDMANEFVNQIYYTKRYIPELERISNIHERLFVPEQFIFLRHALANCEPREGGIGNMVNCGAAMYIAPIAAVNAMQPMKAYNEAIAFAQGHQNSYGLEAAGVLAACIAEAYKPDVTIENILDVAIRVAKDGTKMAITSLLELARELRPKKNDRSYVVQALQKAIKPYSPMGDDVNRSPQKLGKPSNHYTPSRLLSIEELPVALFYIALHEGAFEESILDGVNSGRDTDSIGVMIGAILGALNGPSIVPTEYITDIEHVNQYPLREIGQRFSITAEQIIRQDICHEEQWIEQMSRQLGEEVDE